jgi:hypothetical protein
MDPINLNKARKARAKAQAKDEAAANRVKFGRTKTAKAVDRLEAARSERTLQGAKIESLRAPRPSDSDD